jgi:hypothetical protein
LRNTDPLGQKDEQVLSLEARVGFEPTDGGFADLSLRPLGYRAGCKEYIETAIELSVVETKGEFACSTETDLFIQ